jgi:hypothetical protein
MFVVNEQWAIKLLPALADDGKIQQTFSQSACVIFRCFLVSKEKGM